MLKRILSNSTADAGKMDLISGTTSPRRALFCVEMAMLMSRILPGFERIYQKCQNRNL